MERDVEQTPPLVAAPRHLRRRRLRADIPDPLLVPDVEPYPWGAKASAPAKRRVQASSAAGKSAYQRKRLVALIAVVAVSLCIPALIAALVLAG